MEDKPDIRRSMAPSSRQRCKVSRDMVIEAVKQASEKLGGEYRQKLVVDIDGEQALRVGIWHKDPNFHVMMRTGAHYAKTVLWNREKFYTVDSPIAVGSAQWTDKATYLTGDSDDSDEAIIACVEKARDCIQDCLEAILQKKYHF